MVTRTNREERVLCLSRLDKKREKEGKRRKVLDISRNEPKWKKKGKGKRKEENCLVSAGKRCGVTDSSSRVLRLC